MASFLIAAARISASVWPSSADVEMGNLISVILNMCSNLNRYGLFKWIYSN